MISQGTVDLIFEAFSIKELNFGVGKKNMKMYENMVVYFTTPLVVLMP